jgi:predicted DNA-binding transcriptional regulator YafY
VLVKYKKHFENIQNAMTLYGEPIKKATCKASAKIAIYFQKDMKPFLSSQKYIRTCDDGSIDFELSYTQAIEVLPFIKQWLPDIKILEPKSLIDTLKKDILQASSDYIS